MVAIEDLLEQLKASGQVHFSDLFKVCEHYFGKPRNSGSSHFIFKTPWQGDPRINIQNDKGKAKPYQVRQVLAAIAKLVDLQVPKESKKKLAIPVDRKPPKRK